MLPKVHGGLAMCNLEDMNSACLMKLGWYIQNGNKKLRCDVMRGKHVGRASSKEYLESKSNDYFIYMVLEKIWLELEMQEVWSMDNGNVINMQSDKWITEDLRLKDVVPNIHVQVQNWTMSQFTDIDGTQNFAIFFGVYPL